MKLTEKTVYRYVHNGPRFGYVAFETNKYRNVEKPTNMFGRSGPGTNLQFFQGGGIFKGCC